jgi:hypothetical protein
MILAIYSTICTLKQLFLMMNMHWVLCELGKKFYIQFILTSVFKAVSWLRRLAAVPCPRRLVFDATSLLVRFLVDQVASGQVFLRVLRFQPVSVTLPMLLTHVRLQKVKWGKPGKLPRNNFCRKLYRNEWKHAFNLNFFKGLNKHTHS